MLSSPDKNMPAIKVNLTPIFGICKCIRYYFLSSKQETILYSTIFPNIGEDMNITKA